MVIVLRAELRLTAGKAAVQVAHAAVQLYAELEKRSPETLKSWARGGQKKIVLTVPSLDELETLRRSAAARGLPVVMVEDAGLTEVAPGTKTCLGIGPARSSEVDAVTGRLDLY